MSVKTGLAISVVLLLLSLGALYYNNVGDNRPTIVLQKINTTPERYIGNHPSIMLPAESVLREAYQLKKNVKWRTEYVYAYVITKPNRLFNKEKYLQFHPEDGVDYKIIFSNKEPDPQLFIVEQ
jgi:hypothetical protein